MTNKKRLPFESSEFRVALLEKGTRSFLGGAGGEEQAKGRQFERQYGNVG